MKLTVDDLLYLTATLTEAEMHIKSIPLTPENAKPTGRTVGAIQHSKWLLREATRGMVVNVVPELGNQS